MRVRPLRRGASSPGIDLDRADLTAVALRAGSGDRAAERAFVARTMPDVWRFCAHLIGPDHADDAAQATYLRALRSLPSFRGDSSAKTWLLGVARHVCMDELRVQTRHDRIEARLAGQPAPDGQTPGPGLPAELAALVRDLEPARREAFVLTQVLGFSYEEAAEVAGCPIGTIRSRVARARTDLVDNLADPEARTTTA